MVSIKFLPRNSVSAGLLFVFVRFWALSDLLKQLHHSLNTATTVRKSSMQLPGAILCVAMSLSPLPSLSNSPDACFIYLFFPSYLLPSRPTHGYRHLSNGQSPESPTCWCCRRDLNRGGHRWKEQWDVYALSICTLTFSFHKLDIFPFLLIKDNHMHLLQAAADEWTATMRW